MDGHLRRRRIMRRMISMNNIKRNIQSVQYQAHKDIQDTYVDIGDMLQRMKENKGDFTWKD